MRRFLGSFSFLCLFAIGALKAHDTWVQTNTNLVRTGDVVHIDLMLGNHGNEHRDFKLASKIGLDGVKTIEVRGPIVDGNNGSSHDLRPDFVDLGLAPKEGFHSARFVPDKPGLYCAVQTMDRVVNHGKSVRAIKTAKAFFGVSDSLDKPAVDFRGFEKPLGQGLELVYLTNPVSPVGPGTNIKVQLLLNGKPLSGTKVSFIPRGTVLKEGTDPDYERITDKEGKATFAPKVGTFHLIVAHLNTTEKGEGFESTAYSAALNLFVPQKCACCGD
jgi:uncharacterized GH25 family protein